MFPVAVVADFGLSTKIPEYPVVLQQAGTQNWMAPEVLKEQFYNEKVGSRENFNFFWFFKKLI